MGGGGGFWKPRDSLNGASQNKFSAKISRMTFAVVIQPDKKELLLLLQRSSDKHGAQGPVEEAGHKSRKLEKTAARETVLAVWLLGHGRLFKLVRHAFLFTDQNAVK